MFSLMLLVCRLRTLKRFVCFISFGSSVCLFSERLAAYGGGCGCVLFCCGLGNRMVCVVCWWLWDHWPSQRGGNSAERRPSSTERWPKDYVSAESQLSTRPREQSHTLPAWACVVLFAECCTIYMPNKKACSLQSKQWKQMPIHDKTKMHSVASLNPCTFLYKFFEDCCTDERQGKHKPIKLVLNGISECHLWDMTQHLSVGHLSKWSMSAFFCLNWLSTPLCSAHIRQTWIEICCGCTKMCYLLSLNYLLFTLLLRTINVSLSIRLGADSLRGKQ